MSTRTPGWPTETSVRSEHPFALVRHGDLVLHWRKIRTVVAEPPTANASGGTAMAASVNRRALLKRSALLAGGLVAAPLVGGRAVAAAMKMRLSSSLAND